MDITTKPEGQLTFIQLSGSLDAKEAPAVKKALQDVLNNGVKKLVVDMEAVGFIDSSGLAALVSTLLAARKNDADVALCGLTPAVRSVLELTRLHRVFNVYEDATAAVAR
ncbi:MAG: anti-sigma B factor antagonist [Pseudohongiellaceae bacterium]|jgi:anti-sigma B factor antagonist